jgi:MFS family permease
MQPKKKINYMWVMVFVCFMLGFFCLGFCSGNKSLYLAAITDALGIKRSLFSIGDSIRYLTTAGVNLFFGSLLHKLGVRKMVGAGILALIIQSVLSAVATNIWGFYAAGLFLGIGLAFCTTTMISFVIRRWCKENTGKILGFVLAANGVGAAAAAQVVSPIIYNPENPFGYRIAYLIMAACLAVVALIVLPLIKEQPEEGPSAKPVQKQAKSRDWVGMDYADAKKKGYFYIAALCIFATGMCLQALSGIAAAHMKDVGLEPDFVARMVSLQALVMACTKFLTGVSYDKFGMRVTMTICDVAAVIATVLLTLTNATATGMALAAAFAVMVALALPLETIMLSLFAAELFGNRAFPKTMGIFAAVNTAGYAVGNPIANWVFDTFGSYNPIILTFGAIMLAVTIVFQFILSAAYKDRKIILAAVEEKTV